MSDDTTEEIPGDDVPQYEEGDEDRRQWLDDPSHVEIEDVEDDDGG